MPISPLPLRCDKWQPRALLLAGIVLLALAALPISLNGADIIRFKGTVKRGEPFQYKVHDGLIFGLRPKRDTDPYQGWQFWLGPSEQIDTYAAIATGPTHGLTDMDICASDFRNSDNSGPNQNGPKNVNRPQRLRHFRFVINQTDYETLDNAEAANQVTSEVLQHVNTGRVNITGLSLGNLHAGSHPTI